jgi:lysophospholipase L1-like esterase
MYSGSGGDVLTFTEFRCETIVDRPTYIIGDSFTANGSADTELSEITGMTVTTKGASGEALHSIAARFNADIVANNPEIVIIQGGVNNLAAAVSSPLASMQASIQSMVAAARTAKILPILVNVAPWSHNQYWTAERQTWTEEYNMWLQSYAAGMGLQYVDIYTALAESEGSLDLATAYDSGDGLHPNGAGYTVIGGLYANAVDALIGVTAPNNHISIMLTAGEDYTAASDLLTAGDTITFSGVGGHVDMSALNETDAESITVRLVGNITQFTPKAGVTVLEGAGGVTPQLVIGGSGMSQSALVL